MHPWVAATAAPVLTLPPPPPRAPAGMPPQALQQAYHSQLMAESQLARQAGLPLSDMDAAALPRLPDALLPQAKKVRPAAQQVACCVCSFEPFAQSDPIELQHASPPFQYTHTAPAAGSPSTTQPPFLCRCGPPPLCSLSPQSCSKT